MQPTAVTTAVLQLCCPRPLRPTPPHQVDRKFVLMMCGNVLVAADQHAADERIRLEFLTAAVTEAVAAAVAGGKLGVGSNKDGVAKFGVLSSLALTAPQSVTLTGSEVVAWEQYKGRVEAWGWRLQPQLIGNEPRNRGGASSSQQPCGTEQEGGTLSSVLLATRTLLLTHVPCVLGGVPLNSTDLKVGQSGACDGCL